MSCSSTVSKTFSSCLCPCAHLLKSCGIPVLRYCGIAVLRYCGIAECGLLVIESFRLEIIFSDCPAHMENKDFLSFLILLEFFLPVCLDTTSLCFCPYPWIRNTPSVRYTPSSLRYTPTSSSLSLTLTLTDTVWYLNYPKQKRFSFC